MLLSADDVLVKVLSHVILQFLRTYGVLIASWACTEAARATVTSETRVVFIVVGVVGVEGVGRVWAGEGCGGLIKMNDEFLFAARLFGHSNISKYQTAA